MSHAALRQPDENPYAPVVFRPSLGGRETAWLNEIMVGEVVSAGWGQLRRAQAIVSLPGVPQRVIGADNFNSAKHKLADAVREWIPAAGLRT